MKLNRIFLLLLNLNASIGFSCLCGDLSVANNYETDFRFINDADVVVKGRIIEIKDSIITYSNHIYKQLIYVEILKTLKGQVNPTIEVVNTEVNSSCDFGFKLDDTLYFFLNYKKNQLHFQACAGTFRCRHDVLQIDSLNTIRLDYLKKINNRIRLYYSNGQITAKGRMKKGIPIGKWKFYDYLGNVLEEGNYKNGKKEGLWTHHIYRYETALKGNIRRPTKSFEILETFQRFYSNNVSVDKPATTQQLP